MLEEISHRHLPASTQGMSEVVATGGFESGNGCGILRPLRHPPIWARLASAVNACATSAK